MFFGLTTIRSDRLLCQPRKLYLNNFWWKMYTNGRCLNTSCQIFPAMATYGASLLEFLFFFFFLFIYKYVKQTPVCNMTW